MKTKEIRIETGRIGFRSKTWTVLFISISQAANFGLSCSYWQVRTDLEATGLFGWLFITTLGAVAAAVSEARRKPFTNAFTLRIKSGDDFSGIEQTFEQVETPERLPS